MNILHFRTSLPLRFAATLLLSLIPAAMSAGIGTWTSYTDMRTVSAVTSSGSTIWAGSAGGVFSLDLAESSYVKFTNADGLTGIDVSAIAVDTAGYVWVGEQSGAIDVYDPRSGAWRNILDILASTKIQKQINAFYQHNDTMFVATQFGVEVYSMSRVEFEDAYSNFGSSAQPSVSDVRVAGGRVFVATSAGLAVSRPGAVNLVAPDSWQSFLTPSSPSALALFGGEVYAAASGGLYAFTGTSWAAVPGVSGQITALVASDSLLYIVQPSQVSTMMRNGTVAQYGPGLPSVGVSGTMFGGKLAVGLQSLGVGLLGTDNLWKVYAPNGPASNYFFSVLVDNKGTVWGASGRNDGRGFYSFDGSAWRNYTSARYPVLGGDAYYRISLGTNNAKWVCGWGLGVALVDDAGKIVRVYNSTFPGFGSADPVSPNVVVCGGAAVDRDGNTWLSILRAQDGKVVWEMKPDSTWVSYIASQSTFDKNVFGPAIDGNGTKWFVSDVPGWNNTDVALSYFNEALNVAGSSDGWGTVTTQDGLTNGTTSCAVVDLDGDVWIGTATGITIISDPAHPSSRVSRVYVGAVRDEYITSIVVDALNNKWVATHTGVFVLSPDGTSILGQYTVASTGRKLADDDVLSLAYDEKRGVMYFGTDKGLSSLQILTVAPADEFTTLKIAPNPYRLSTAGGTRVMISGLVRDSEVKILTVAGTLVKQLVAEGGGRTTWDGTDDEGRLVASGIYYVVAYADNGNQLATAKLAVLR